MANTILNNVKLIICNDTTANWGLSTKVLSKGETGYEFKADGSVGIKIGDGAHTWAIRMILEMYQIYHFLPKVNSPLFNWQ